MNSPPLNDDLTAVASRIAIGDISSVAVTESVLSRIARLDGDLQTYVHLNPDAMAEAHKCADEIMRGELRGPLHGVPIAVKDNYLTADMPTTAGTVAPGYHFSRHDSTAVARLRAAGAVLIGKTRTHEFAWGTICPPTRNPWDVTRVPGGSSGGSAAAVAGRLCVAALGRDTRGSLRNPARLCGLVRLEPTFR